MLSKIQKLYCFSRWRNIFKTKSKFYSLFRWREKLNKTKKIEILLFIQAEKSFEKIKYFEEKQKFYSLFRWGKVVKYFQKIREKTEILVFIQVEKICEKITILLFIQLGKMCRKNRNFTVNFDRKISLHGEKKLQFVFILVVKNRSKKKLNTLTPLTKFLS